MKIKKEVNYLVKEFEPEELTLSQHLFGLIPQSVYFNFSVDLDIDTDKHKLVYVYGLSGEGKSVFKEALKEQLITEYYVSDYDLVSDPMEVKISEIFDLEKDRDFLIRLFSTFGMLEMRNVFSRLGDLSAGQQKRVRYMSLLYDAYRNRDKKCLILCDEFLTFVDSLSAKVFAQGLRKFMKKNLPDVILFAFGCNDTICMYWEDLNIHLVNGKVYNITEVTDVDRDGN